VTGQFTHQSTRWRTTPNERNHAPFKLFRPRSFGLANRARLESFGR
jgi:hypothetical protein